MPRLKKGEYPKSAVAHLAREKRDIFFKPGDTPQEAYDRMLPILGGKITTVFGDDREETLRVAAKKDFEIYLPFSTSGARNNFTIAHELGHYFLHTDFEGDQELLLNRRGSNRREWEANWFAAEFLMPEDEFRRSAVECEKNEMRLALKFGVSPAAANVRMSALNID
ncbi:ImmA/IrrE family metallo-endopeptidase [Pseudodesulfovibrio sp. JC047]|uniref:ImmA/IrrE family metallo-endopeptidase n=1 Tax=Pseudodesulfovibrio sp. JC047 TaxID=2683199 RepID=UPI0013D73E34|nr:ImmA/IrrE family metallo-endopeptidase [Pseudodesulfovibrio sp. JC047]NDV20276.1 ImmA/IrrE family metallo-endopeptidase [Pseudodesulfovibrio sp. JC047]